MTDRNVQYPSRYKLTLVEGTSDVYELTPAPGEVSAEGTILNKANLLSDNTAQALGLPQADPTVNDALNQLSGKQDPWQLIDLLDNTGEMAGTWTAPDVFEGENYDLGVYMIGGGASGASRTSGTFRGASGGASGYGKNFIINNVAPNTQYSYVVGAGGEAGALATGNAGGTTSFNGVEADGGSGGLSSSGTNTQYFVSGANGGQGSDGLAYDFSMVRDIFGCCPASSSDESVPGKSQSPRTGQNQFDQNMVTLCAGGGAYYAYSTYNQAIGAMPDGTKGGNGGGENATGYGNGGGGNVNGASGAGSDGAIFLYARRRSPIEYQVSITVLDQDSNPVDGIAINGLYSNAEGSRNGLAVTGSNGVATGISYQQQATFTTDAYTDLTAGSVSLVMTEGSVTEGTINVTFTNFVQWTASGTARFSHYVKRIDVSAAGGGGGGGLAYTAESAHRYVGGGGGAGGYAIQQTDVSFEPDTDYPATVGAGGKAGSSTGTVYAPEDGGQSSFLGVTANGGHAGTSGGNSSAAVGNGNGAIGWISGSASGQDNSAPATAGTQQIYASFTEMKTVGGGGGCGSYNNAPSNGANVGAAPNGGKGANKDAAATAGGVAGGGGGAYRESGGGAVQEHGAGNRGGRGEVAIRLYNTHTLPTS